MSGSSIVCRIFIFAALSVLCLRPAERACGEDADDSIRPSVLSGTWYPGTREKLTKDVKEYLSEADPRPPRGNLKAIIVPHAGYRYSGRVAAFAYRLLEGKAFRRIILLGPSHRFHFSGASVNLRAGYATPLGTVPVDQELCRKLMESSKKIRTVQEAHINEHSIEIQLPFLQVVLGDFQIVPILMGQQDLETCRELADSIVSALEENDGTLLVASSDLSHFHSGQRAERLDSRFTDRVKKFDPDGLAKDLSQGKCEACGHGAVITVMLAARRLGADSSKILSYSHSGNVTGDNDRVVGYLSAVLFKSYYKDPHPE